MSADVPPAPFDSLAALVEAEQTAIRLEQAGAYADALDVCELVLRESAFDPQSQAALRAEAQFQQRRLRLRRKLGLPAWSSQGAEF